MIRIHGHDYDLPEHLSLCPRQHAWLAWDGRWAWRCPHETNTGSLLYPTINRCGFGLSIAALFDDSGLDLKLGAGCELRDLTMTRYGLGLVSRGEMRVDWLTPDEADNRLHNLPDEDKEDEELREIKQLMRHEKMPRVGVGRRIR